MGHCFLTPATVIKQAPVHCSWRNQVFSLTLLGVSWSCSEGFKHLWRLLVGRTVSEVALSAEVLVMCGDSSQRVSFLDSWDQLHRGQLGPAKPGNQWSREQVRWPHQGDEEAAATWWTHLSRERIDLQESRWWSRDKCLVYSQSDNQDKFAELSQKMGASLVAQSVKNLPAVQRPGFNPWNGKIPWRRKWQPTPVSLPGKSHGHRNLVGCSPRGLKESARLSN